MCGRYYIAAEDSSAELQEIIADLQRRSGADSVKLGEVRPSDHALVLTNNRKLEKRAFSIQWGYSFPDSRPIINARSETASSKSLFRDGMLQRRCLIPASYYFEWKHQENRRIKYAIHPKGCTSIYMAGIYHLEHEIPRFVILTRAASQDIEHIHDRMPVILPEEMRSDWLNVKYDANEVIHAAQLNMDYRAV